MVQFLTKRKQPHQNRTVLLCYVFDDDVDAEYFGLLVLCESTIDLPYNFHYELPCGNFLLS